jgi:hypothetical protein
MYIVTVLFKDGRFHEYITEEKGIFMLVAMCNDSDGVARFKVCGSSGFLKPEHFGFGDLAKWKQTLFGKE